MRYGEICIYLKKIEKIKKRPAPPSLTAALSIVKLSLKLDPTSNALIIRYNGKDVG